jgi:gliding motility-associated-like protein
LNTQLKSINSNTHSFSIMRWLLVGVFCFVMPQWVFSQCSLNIPNDGCKSELINFEYVTSSTVLTSNWNFGDGNSSSQNKPFHQYSATGTFTVTVNLILAGGGICTASKDITIHDLPTPLIAVSSESEYCLDINDIELIDSSTSGVSGGYIDSRVVLWGDGGRTVSNYPNINKRVSYQYNIPGTYDIDVELINNKGCKIKSKYQVTVLPVYIPSFQFSDEHILCDSVEVCLTNDSINNSNDLKSLKWIWGNGLDTVGFFQSICHKYSTSNTFIIELEATHKNGCKVKSTKFRNVVIPNLFLNPSMGKKRQCVSEKFTFIQAPRTNVTYYWKITDDSNNIVDAKVGSVFNGTYIVPGKYYVELRGQSGECSKFYYDSIEVVGILPFLKLLNNRQCENKDTVYFNAYLKMYGTKNFEVLWDFKDSLAPQCTTQVTGTNYECNYSKQVFARHKYDSQGCFQASFYVRDLDNGCTWREDVFITISTISTEDVSYKVKRKCVGTHGDFQFTFFAPECISDILVNYDSACNPDVFQDFTPKRNYGYVCNPSGWVTVGFKMVNGDAKIYRSNDTTDYYIDSSRVCILDFWKHNWFRLNPAPIALFTHANGICPPAASTILPSFVIQPNVTGAEIDWGDATKESFPIVPSNDSLGPYYHIYDKSGIFPIWMQFQTDSGCYDTWIDTIIVGHYSTFFYDPIVCPGKEITLVDEVRYFKNENAYWRSPSRRNLGYETILWDLGDGKGFSYDKPVPIVKFDKPGKYEIKLATKDINDCWDTLVNFISVTGINANIRPITKKIVCDDIIQFFDSSDLKQFFGLDSIVEYYWDFGDGKLASFLKNPFHYYSSYGNFTVTHGIKTLSGCSDTIRTTIFIGGPIPQFEIKDTVGCAPFTAEFINQSNAVTRYIWYYGDQSSTTYSTAKDSNVKFTYNLPGIYDIYLFGSDSVINPDNQNKIYYCSAWFPDSSTANPPLRRVVVLPKPSVDFDLDNDGCLNQALTLSSKADPLYTYFNWKVDNDSFTALNKDTSIWFQDTGVHVIRFTPTYDYNNEYDLGCFNEATKTINIHYLAAEYSFEKGLKCNDFNFTTLTKNPKEIEWKFGKGNTVFGTSNEFSPKFDFKTEKGYADVCLKITDSFGCVDEFCDTIKLEDNAFKLILPNVFTPGVDGKNDAFDIDIENYGYYKLTIYNRWGEIVYTSTQDGFGNDEINWNGGYMNSLNKLPNGAYFYLLETKELCDPEAQIQKITGTVTLIREQD